MTAEATRRAAERAARDSYGRLLALVTARSRNIAAAEDALGDALVSALRTWPERGVPERPEAWLLTSARNAISNVERHGEVRRDALADIEQILYSTQPEAAFPDERLKLLFVCAHPAIDAGFRAPLMLQTVLGLEAARIARVFLVAPGAMAQRLVRAKSKIRDAGLRFEIPGPEEWSDRLSDVLDAVYAAYGTGWDSLDPVAEEDDLAGEAIYLGRLIVTLMPDEPEAKGLLALMLYCEARKAARRDGNGRFVPLSEQDHRLWSRDMIIEAEQLLTEASRSGRFGRYQCEAAIQSVHIQRPITGRTNLAALRALYDLLAQHAPSIGVLVGRAAILLRSGEAHRALMALDEIPLERVEAYQPWWVTRARTLESLGHLEEAAQTLQRAVALTADHGLRAFLLEGSGTSEP